MLVQLHSKMKILFQSMLSWRERLTTVDLKSKQFKFQSTPPWRERHQGKLTTRIYFDIPIHAPVKGATEAEEKRMEKHWISIHAPAKGATAIFHKIINLYCETSTNTTRINSLNINKKYINRIKARILNYFFGANHLINLCKLYIRTCDL